MNNLDTIIKQAENFATKIILAYSEKIIYHDYKFAKRYVQNIPLISDHAQLSEEEKKLGIIGSWIIAASYEGYAPKFDKSGKFKSKLTKNISATFEAFVKLHPIDESIKNKLSTAFNEIIIPNIPETNLGKLLADAMMADIIVGGGQKNVKKMYEEMLLHDVNISKTKWYDLSSSYVQNLTFNLSYCKAEFQPKIEALLLDLQKEKKKLEKTSDLALKRELNISEQELKALKKNLEGSKGRDARGIQTVFRTTSKNHYTLNEMVDRKANIMITVNSIILSLVLGGVIGKEAPMDNLSINMNMVPVLILTITSVLSIIFAILSIRPEVTHGQFTEDEIRNKKGNLLYYGNFHGMHQRDYEWGFLQMLNDQDYLYTSMIRDIYYLGLNLKRKFHFIRKSLTIFLFGIVLSVLSYLLFPICF